MAQLAILDAAPGAGWVCSPQCSRAGRRSLEVRGRFVGPWAEVVLAEASSSLEVIALQGSREGLTATSVALERLGLVCEQMRLHEAHRQRSWHWELGCLRCDLHAALLPGSTPLRLGVETPRAGRSWERSTHRVERGGAPEGRGHEVSLETFRALEYVFGAGLALEGGAVRQLERIPLLWCGVGRGQPREAEVVSYTDWVLTDGRCVLRSPEGVELPYVPGDPIECYLGEGEGGDEVGASRYALSCALEVRDGSFAAQVRETRHGGGATQLLQQMVVTGRDGAERGVRALRAALGGL